MSSRPCLPGEPRSRALTRRSLVRATGAGVAVATGVSSAAHATAASFARRFAAGPPTARGTDAITALLHKATLGYTEKDYVQARALGHDAWLDRQLHPETIPDSEAELAVQPFITIDMTAPFLYGKFGGGMEGIAVAHLRAATVARAIVSQRQLFERAVEFWTDHLNVFQLLGDVRLLKNVEDREVQRRHALGRFRELIHASAKSAAMVRYLDSYANVVGAPNENYARELMELHTVGVHGPYNENDVRELARCFTGWTYDYVSPPTWGEFRFLPQWHDWGTKQVLGLTIEPRGLKEAEQVIDLLARHDDTARFVGRKLLVRFLDYEPSDAQVDEVAAVFHATDGDLRELLRAVLSHANVVGAGRKLKRPFHFVVGLLRALDAEVDDMDRVYAEVATMGHGPFQWVTPDGYPDDLAAWGSDVLLRWSFASRLLDGEIPGASVPAARLAQLRGGVEPANIAARIDAFLTGGALDPLDVADVQAFVDTFPTFKEPVFREAIALAASSPGYQYY